VPAETEGAKITYLAGHQEIVDARRPRGRVALHPHAAHGTGTPRAANGPFPFPAASSMSTATR